MFIANLDTKAKIEELHDGLQRAMDELINQKDYAEAERILRIVDGLMVQLIHNLQLVR